MANKKKKKNEDWYAKLLDEEEQYYQNLLASRKRFTKKEIRAIHRKKTKETQHLEGFSAFVNDQLNPFLFNGKYSMYMIRDGRQFIVIDWSTNQETVFVPLYTTQMDTESSLIHAISEVGEAEKKAHIHFKRNNFTDKDGLKIPLWKQFNKGWSVGPQLDMKKGGFTYYGSWRNQDHIDCVLTKNEFVVTAPAVRGLGKGSYHMGALILFYLQDIWKRESKRYPHKR